MESRAAAASIAVAQRGEERAGGTGGRFTEAQVSKAVSEGAAAVRSRKEACQRGLPASARARGRGRRAAAWPDGEPSVFELALLALGSQSYSAMMEFAERGK
uniref:Uncharacterized protein n=1 Tax=Alexandrium catenella TaxID=2925 RepID=A0A7S1QL39_ALECA